MNIMLDRLPDNYEGYLIRTDFRIGIQIDLCLRDDSIPEYERLAIALNLLYGNGMPELEKALKGLKWFLMCGKEQELTEDDGQNEQVFDFDIDDTRLYSSFKRAYGIDLTKDRLHWFQFVSLIGDLGDCAFTQAIHFRTADISEMKGKERERYAKMKRRLKLPTSYTSDEKETINEFLEKLK